LPIAEGTKLVAKGCPEAVVRRVLDVAGRSTSRGCLFVEVELICPQ